MKGVAIQTNLRGQKYPLPGSHDYRDTVCTEREYTVYAISRFKGVCFFLIVSERRLPEWVPAVLFRLTDNALPPGWVCSLGDEDVEMVLGPAFIADSIEDYGAMVELYDGSVRQFWWHVESSSGS